MFPLGLFSHVVSSTFLISVTVMTLTGACALAMKSKFDQSDFLLFFLYVSVVQIVTGYTVRTVLSLFCCGCSSSVSPQASLQFHPVLSWLMPIRLVFVPAWCPPTACLLSVHQGGCFPLCVVSCGFLPLTSSPGHWPLGCQPQMVNYLLSEPW